MNHVAFSERATVRRVARRASYDPAVIEAILDEGLVAHAAFDHDGHPFVVPMAYVRVGREVMVHGAIASRFLKTAGLPMSLCVTSIDGLVYAKSAFHRSVNYRSVVILGTARDVTDGAEKRRFLDALVERVSPGRSKIVRPPNAKELAATRVLALPIDEASAKVRTGGPIDDDEDLQLPVWSGHLPIRIVARPLVALDDAASPPEVPRGIDRI